MKFAVAALVTIGVAAMMPRALAAQRPALDSVQITRPQPSTRTAAIVTATMTQIEYENVSFNVAFQGFQAHRTIPFGPRECPAGVARVQAPAVVFKCGWMQQGDTAILRLALEGTFDASRIRIQLAPGALTTPQAPGLYAVTLSGWSFPDVRGCVRIGRDSLMRGDVSNC